VGLKCMYCVCVCVLRCVVLSRGGVLPEMAVSFVEVRKF
jgi:hypothetical protein